VYGLPQYETPQRMTRRWQVSHMAARMGQFGAVETAPQRRKLAVTALVTALASDGIEWVIGRGGIILLENRRAIGIGQGIPVRGF